jgi:CRISPR-associated protein Cas2
VLVVIAYDISDDKRRSKLAKLLASYGERVQRSVFEAHLEAPQLITLRAKVHGLLEPQDAVRFYKLGEAYRERVGIEGPGSVTSSPRFLIA